MISKTFTVLYVLHDTNMGGATISLLDSLKALCREINAIVITPYDGPACSALSKMGIRYHIIPFKSDIIPASGYNKEQELRSFWVNYRSAKTIEFFLEKQNVDINIIHTNSSVNYIGALLSIMLNVPHIWHFREFVYEDFGWCFLNTEVQKALVNSSDYRIAISKSIKNKYENMFGTSYELIYNGLDVEKYKKELINNRNKSFYIAGSISEGKGQIDAIKAVEYLKNKCGIQDISLHIIGAGDERLIWLLKKYIKKNDLERHIIIHRFKNDLSEIRSQCSYSLMCSKQEALGRVTIEAMMAGIFVIGANTGGTVELVGENGERGILYQQGDYVSLAKSMKDAMSLKQDEYERIVISAQQFAVNNFDSKKYAERLKKIYRSMGEMEPSLERERVRIKTREIISDYYKSIDENQMLCNAEAATNDKKNENLVSTLKKWMRLNRLHGGIGIVLGRMNIKNIAIYGIGHLGRLLYDELEGTEIVVKYYIDLYYEDRIGFVDCMKPIDVLPRVDCIIVTVIGYEDDIIRQYKKKIGIPMYSITMLMDNALADA